MATAKQIAAAEKKVTRLRAVLDKISLEMDEYWFCLGKTRKPHPDERYSYTPTCMTMDANDATFRYVAYSTAVATPLFAAIGDRPSAVQIEALWVDADEKRKKLAIMKKLGPEFASVREIADAMAAAHIAERLHSVAYYRGLQKVNRGKRQGSLRRERGVVFYSSRHKHGKGLR